MPRRNLYILVFALALSFVCYHKADSAHRNHYGPMFETFTEAMAEIKDHYLYFDKVSERELFEGAMHGLAAKLDPYSGYSGYDETRDFHESLDQEFGGIGIEVNWDRDTKTLSVMSPIVGTPAYEAGIMAGDLITKINDDPTDKFTDSRDAVRRIKGKPDETVRLTILHPGDKEPRELTITRAIIKVDTVLGDRRSADGKWDYTLESDPRIGYIRITQFGDKTVDEMTVALEQCREKHIKGLILDLRNDPGGLLDAAYKVCDFFVPSGIIVTIRERDRKERERREATGKAAYTDWPIVVLVNQFSASASEIVAACLQDHGRAIVVGERSFGKGTVQKPIDLEHGKSLLRLTIASYWRPSEKNIHRAEDAKESDEWGVRPSPSYEVKVDDKRLLEILQLRRDRDVVRRPGDKPLVRAKPSATPTPSATPSGTASAPEKKAKDEPKSDGASSSDDPAKPQADTGAKKDAGTKKDTDDSKKDSAPEVVSTDPLVVDPQLGKAVEYLREKIGK